METAGSLLYRTNYAQGITETKEMATRHKDVTMDTEMQTEGTFETVEAPSWTERRSLKRQHLSTAEVASLIVNKMIGTGIFTTPGTMLALTHDKRLALGLWIVGGFYAALSLLVYLDYGTGLPFNGAELIYLTRVYSYARFKLLPPVVFASYFICLFHTAGNALAFARYMVIAHLPSPNAGQQYNLSFTLIKAFAVLILAVVCFLLWVHPRMGLVLSKTFAAFKLLLLFILGFWGIASRHKTLSDGLGSESPSTGHLTQDWAAMPGSSNAISRVAGFIYVAYSYGGWESACYVLGEFDKSDKRWIHKVRYGAFSAVFLVSMAYIVLVIGYFESCSYDEIVSYKAEGDLGIARIFATKLFGAPDAIKVCIAMSGFGNLIAVAYTSTKVKQAIALHHFLPFSTFLGSDEPFNTPTGALLLHWTVSSIFIIAAPSDANGYSFLIGLTQYGQLIVAAAVGIGRFKLEGAIKAANLEFHWKPLVPSRTLNHLAGFALFVVNIMICVASAWPRDAGKPDPGAIPTYLWPTVVFSYAAAGLIYWCVLLWLQHGLGDKLGWRFSIRQTEEESDLDRHRRRTRRDGTEERYHYERIQAGTIAYRVKTGWMWMWDKIDKYL